MDKTTIKIGSDFSGVGAFNQALRRLGIEYDELFACDMDKYARQTFELNYGKPKDFPLDVYEREIPKESLDIYMTSPPCQAFSMAGKRLGKEDNRGILFFNSLEFIQTNKPRYFIFENVKGLLSHDKQDPKAQYGRTFQEWINYLGGKSVNGVHTFFPYEDAVPYHIYFQVLNAKDYNIPQNRERIFIIGIRDDEDNNFSFPKPVPLTKRLKDVLEPEVDEKYFLSDKMLDYLTTRKDNFNNGNINFKDENSVASTITKSSSSLDISDNIIRLGNVNPSGNGMNGNVFSEDGISPTLSTNKGEGIKIVGYTRDAKGKVTSRHEKDISGTIHTASGGGGNTDQFVKVGTWRTHEDGKGFREMEDNLCPTIPARAREDGSGQPVIKIGAIRGRNPQNQKSRQSGLETEQMLEINENGTSNALTTVQKDNVVVYDLTNDFGEETREYTEFSPSLRSSRSGLAVKTNTSKGYDEAEEEEEEEEDSINFSVPNSKTRRGRVGKKVSQTLDTQCNQGIFTKNLFNTDKNINFDGILKSIDNEKRNTAKVLLMLQQEIGKTAIETWGLRILEVIREKTLLQQRLHEESFHSKRKKSARGVINKIQQTESFKIDSYVIMRSLPKEGWERCSPQRRKSIKQLVRQLNESLQKLSYENPQTNSNLQSGELQYENKGIRVLRETLSKIQEIQQPFNKQIQGPRIRRLTPTEAFRLMDFNFGIDGIPDFIWNVSDSQAYKQAGNSIAVGVLAAIISKLKL